ncbi:hypothetical protein FISHEDRAFT_34626 [Fistulina hepatica ATCC 64428]|uniref:Metallo-beta-lactamase domain-containing protein n=1 Tax=Fistulina hepatica ATCC 64428 TaxID=1128425 RepID=A0A0D7ANB5_9AGAR|nr:hypothetical protein FISHEDRAFT_34626 [Fistulina hepatica ATCC 64428]
MVAGQTEFIFMGTGTSSCIPNLHCITQVPGDPGYPCKACFAAVTPEGRKNARRNTGAVFRLPRRQGHSADPNDTMTIVIDTGKTFQAAALEWFPKYGLRKIDAVLLTHAHADATNGLDDLRGWTLHKQVQDHVDIYASEATYNEVQRAFPYLVDKKFATGGGAVPEFNWHIVYNNVPFQLENSDVTIRPFNGMCGALLHHGRIFTNKEEIVLPYLCFGFRIMESVVYISDVSYIPDHVWPLLRDANVCVLDCLDVNDHQSHLGIGSAVAYARRIGAKRTYLTGFAHELEHDECVRICEYASGGAQPGDDAPTTVVKSVQRIKEKASTAAPVWMRPAHDGLRVFVSDADVVDETYN